MNKKLKLLILCGLPLLTLACYLLAKPVPSLIPAMLAFPFRQIVMLTRFLAGKGAVGNGLAISIIAVSAAVPSLFALRSERTRNTRPERVVLCLLSVAIAGVLYTSSRLNSDGPRTVVSWGNRSISLSIFAFGVITIWAIVLLYLVLVLVRKVRSGEPKLLLRYFRGLLVVSCALLTLSASASFLDAFGLLAKFESRNADAFIGFFVKFLRILPGIFTILVILKALRYFSASEESAFSDSGKKLCRMCCISLAASTAISAITNIVLYIAFRVSASAELSPGFKLELPLYPMVCVFAVLLYVRIAEEKRKLQEDNSLFI